VSPVSEGFILKMNRLGKNGIPFRVYKLRTMHPYSEFLHEYMIINHGFNAKGKINNDFRMAQWGKSLRRFWLDEIPQLFNLLKGDLKLVGVRPVSESYFKSLPKEIQLMRINHKPGCIPPYVALNVGTTKEDVLTAECVYMEQRDKSPFLTDLRFFFSALYRIVFKGKRSS
jgi:lipopolysaccharide/colanic/teichoic acid biosynthesis glycosyltransferase